MSVWSKIASLGIGEVLSGVGSLAKDLRQALTGDLTPEQKTDLEQRLITMEGQALVAATQLNQVRGSIIVAEAQGDSWLQRNWRPILMMIFASIVANNYIISPYLQALFGFSVSLDLPVEMWELLKIGVGGYIVGRSAEKGLKVWRQKEEF